METSAAEWNRFCDSAAEAMQAVLDNKSTLEELSAFFENSKAISTPDLRQYAVYIIWEIGGARDAYVELLDLFKAHLSEDTIIQRLGEKLGKTHRWPWT